jgi:metallophosphoesterase (TIGR03767 family)
MKCLTCFSLVLASFTVSAQTPKGPTTGTTLESTIKRIPVNSNDLWQYSKLSVGSGEPWMPIKLFPDVIDPWIDHPLIAFAHLTDTQILDHRSPARVPFLDDRDWQWSSTFTKFWGTGSAYRPQEMLSTQLADATARSIRNHKNAAPATGLPLSLTLMTGDLTDNTQANEMNWARWVLNGGVPVEPVSGDRTSIGNNGDLGSAYYHYDYYWHPGGRIPATNWEPYADNNFPNTIGNLYEKARTPFLPTGLGTPWYLALGNHDELAQGNLSVDDPTFYGLITLHPRQYAVGGTTIARIKDLPFDNPTDSTWDEVTLIKDFLASRGNIVVPQDVPADSSRAMQNVSDFVTNFMANQVQSRDFPFGHGFSSGSLDSHYLIPSGPTDPIQFICLDTNKPHGNPGSINGSDGTLNEADFIWLEQQLKACSSRYRNDYTYGSWVSQPAVKDKFIILYAHHPIASINNDGPNSAQRRLRELLLRFPNVVAYLSGHTHANTIKPYAVSYGANNRNGFFDITTASTMDYPNQSRIVELTQSENGVVSINTTMLDLDAPVAWNGDVDTPKGLAALGRELAFNDPQEIDRYGHGFSDSFRAHREGNVSDRNTRLMLPAPFFYTPTVPNTAQSLAVTQSLYAHNPSGAHTMEILGVDVTDAPLNASAYANVDNLQLDVSLLQPNALSGPSKLHAVAAATFSGSGVAAQFGSTSAGTVWWTLDYLSTWIPMSGDMPAGQNTVAAALGGDGKMKVFGTSATNKLFVRSENTVSNGSYLNISWGPWQQLTANAFSSVQAATNLNGKMQLFLTDPFGKIWTMTASTAASLYWTGPTSFDNGTWQAMATARNQDGRLSVFAADNINGYVWVRSQTSPNASTWTPWTVMAPVLNVTKLSAALSEQGRIEVWMVDSNGHVIHRDQIAANANSWGDISMVQGTLRP